MLGVSAEDAKTPIGILKITPKPEKIQKLKNYHKREARIKIFWTALRAVTETRNYYARPIKLR